MNIFKALASGRKSFPEESASVVLAWLMNPHMEHGLGYAFLSEFVERLTVVCPAESRAAFQPLSEKLKPRLRSEEEEEVTCRCQLEYNVDKAIIDILFTFDKWYIAIENKINVNSANDINQLTKQYDGLHNLAKENGRNICSVFLVPNEESLDMLDSRLESVYESIHWQLWNNHTVPDFSAVVTWQKNVLDKVPAQGNGPFLQEVPSVYEIIQSILDKEHRGEIDPVTEYTKHTLKALNAFMINNFEGYEYDRGAKLGASRNPETEEMLKLDKINQLNTGYVGIKNGLAGLIEVDNETLRSREFQYTSKDMGDKRQWLRIDDFKKVARWKLGGPAEPIKWQGSFSASLLFEIAKGYGNKVHIGIQGGEDALENMDEDTIKQKRWQVSNKKKNSQWISGEKYADIIERKSVFT